MTADTSIGQLAEVVVRSLSKAIDENGEPLFEWVLKREDLDPGPFCAALPEVVFLLNENYAAVDDEGRPWISPLNSRNIIPGSHRLESAALLTTSRDCVNLGSATSLRDVHGFIRSRLTSLGNEVG